MMRGVTQVSAHTFEIGGMGDLPVQTVTAPALPAPVVMVSPAAPSTPAEAKPATTRQILAQLRARLAVVKREISTRKQYERERDQLQRLIRAANTELDNVRRLRAAG